MKARVSVHQAFTVGEVDQRVFGGFVEHIGRCVYDGIYEPSHPQADADGFRRDVAALVRDLDMPITRYPGGNFVSGYDWHDTIGPKDRRPVRADYAWKALEPNQVGIDEFVKWCRLAGTAPMMAVNLGTGTAKSAQELVEYCNGSCDSDWCNQRRRNGAEQPHAIKLWCLGNEMDGSWQIGHKTANEYARIANEAGKMMKYVDPSIELVVCGSSSIGMPTFAAWDAEVLEETYEVADYISLHQYFCWDVNSTDPSAFFASPEVIDRQISEIIATCDFVAAKKKSAKRMMLALDEWNVWYRGNVNAHPETEWQAARPINEETYDMADVIVVGGILMTMLSHADRLKVGCLAQTVNVIAPIMTRPGGGVWKQTIYYPFYYMSKYGRGVVLEQQTESPTYECKSVRHPVSCLKSCTVYNSEANELRFFAINRSTSEAIDLELDLSGFEAERVAEAVEIRHDDLRAVNTETEEKVKPAAIPESAYSVAAGALRAKLAPASWNMFRIALR